jgi:hypothetical protein
MVRITALARLYHEATNNLFEVTDGSRTASYQASAMYYKFSHNDFGTYKGKNGQALKAIYTRGVAAKNSKEQILQAMTTEIQRELATDPAHPISMHLEDRAIDIRIVNAGAPTPTDLKTLEQIVGKIGGSVKREDTPVHEHITLPDKIPDHVVLP